MTAANAPVCEAPKIRPHFEELGVSIAHFGAQLPEAVRHFRPQLAEAPGHLTPQASGQISYLDAQLSAEIRHLDTEFPALFGEAPLESFGDDLKGDIVVIGHGRCSSGASRIHCVLDFPDVLSKCLTTTVPSSGW